MVTLDSICDMASENEMVFTTVDVVDSSDSGSSTDIDTGKLMLSW